MKFVAAFKDESGRLAVVDRIRLGLPPRNTLDKYCRIAKALFHAPVAYVSLVGADEIYFVGRHGLPIEKAPREAGLCSATITESVRVLRDAREQLRGVPNSLIHGSSGFRFYAGVSLRVEDHAIGTLAVAGPVPRQPDERELSGLKELGQILEAEFQRSLHPFDKTPLGLENDFSRCDGKKPRTLQALLRIRGYSMAMVLEMAALYAQVREDTRFRMSEKTLYRILEFGQRPNGYHHQALAAILEVDPGDIFRLLEGGVSSASTKGWSSHSRDPIFRVAKVYHPARAHKRAICINPNIELQRISVFRTLSEFLVVQPPELSDIDGRRHFAFIGRDADVNLTPRHLRCSMVVVDPQRTELPTETNAGGRPVFVLQVGRRLVCARVGRADSFDGCRIFPEPSAAIGPVCYGLNEIKILGQVEENPLFQVILPREESFGRSPQDRAPILS
jgi:hypothetical protein